MLRHFIKYSAHLIRTQYLVRCECVWPILVPNDSWKRSLDARQILAAREGAGGSSYLELQIPASTGSEDHIRLRSRALYRRVAFNELRPSAIGISAVGITDFSSPLRCASAPAFGLQSQPRQGCACFRISTYDNHRGWTSSRHAVKRLLVRCLNCSKILSSLGRGCVNVVRLSRLASHLEGNPAPNSESKISFPNAGFSSLKCDSDSHRN